MNRERWKRIVLFCCALIAGLFCVFPVLWMAVLAVSESPYFLSGQTGFTFTLDNLSVILFSDRTAFLRFLLNSLIVSVVSAFLSTIFATIAGYAITRMQFPGKTIFPLFMLSMSMFPQISIAGYLYRMMADIGWINTYFALIFPYVAISLPLGLWIMMSFLSQIPGDLDRAALIDGATRLQIIRKVILPVALPGILSTFMLTLIFCFNEFLFALMMTVDKSSRTVPVGIALFEGLHGQLPWGTIMAAATVSSLPLIVITLIFNRYIVRGLTEGAVKG